MKLESKDLKWLAVIAALVLVGGILGWRACNVIDGLSKREGLYQADKKASEAKEKEYLAKVDKGEREKASLLTENARLQKVIDDSAVEVGGLNGALTTLQVENEKLRALPETVVNLKAVIVNQDGQITNLSMQVKKERTQKENAFVQRDNNYRLYISEKVLHAEAREGWNREKALRESAESIGKGWKTKYALSRLTGDIKTGLIIAAAGYMLIKGK